MLLEFYADWCTTCQAMAHLLADLHNEYRSQINFVMLNVDDPQWRQQIQQYVVTGVPQFTVIGRVPRKIFAEVFDRL